MKLARPRGRPPAVLGEGLPKLGERAWAPGRALGCRASFGRCSAAAPLSPGGCAQQDEEVPEAGT